MRVGQNACFSTIKEILDENYSYYLNISAVEKAAQYLSVNQEQLMESLTHNRREMRGEVFLSPLNEEQATASRDSITMAVYSHLFDWIIR